MKLRRSHRLLVVPVALILALAVMAPAATAKVPILVSPQCAPGAAHPAPEKLCDSRAAARPSGAGTGGAESILAVVALGGAAALIVTMTARSRRTSRPLTPIARSGPR